LFVRLIITWRLLMLLDDGKTPINENKVLLNEMPARVSLPGRSPEEADAITDLITKYYDFMNQVEASTGVTLDKATVERELDDARADTTNFPLDEEGFKKLADFHDELYKRLVLSAYKNKVLDIIFFASKFATMIGLKPRSRDMELLSRYLVDNVGLLASIEPDVATMISTVKSNLRISEGRARFEYDDAADPEVIMRQLLDALRSSHPPAELATLTSMLSSGTASPTSTPASSTSSAASPTAPGSSPTDISSIDDSNSVKAAIEKYDPNFFDAMSAAFIQRAATIVDDEAQFNQFFSNPRYFDADHGKSLQNFKQHFDPSSPDVAKANDFFASIGLIDSTPAVRRFALELADKLQVKRLREMKELNKQTYGIKFSLTECKKQARLNEDFAMLFGGWIQYLLKSMFGNLRIPVEITGTQREVESLAKALRSEQGYLNLVSKYGLDDERTYRSKSQLDRASANFEKETGLKWPFA